MTPQAITETIRAAAEITVVIGEYVQLRPGGLNMVGLCPFHEERTPSFQVSRAKQQFICRGCGVGGDVFRFVERIEGVGFSRARRILADRYAIELEPRGPRLDYATVRRQRAAAEALAAECDWYWRSVRMAYVRRENAMWWLARVAERLMLEATSEESSEVRDGGAEVAGFWPYLDRLGPFGAELAMAPPGGFSVVETGSESGNFRCPNLPDNSPAGRISHYSCRGWRWRRIIERLDQQKDEILMGKFMRARNTPAVKREWAAEQRVNAVIAAVFGEAA